MRKLFVSFVLLVFMIGCKTGHQEGFQYNFSVDPVAVDQPEYESMVKSIEYIPLETTKKSLVGDVTSLYVADGRIYINSDRKKVLCFGEDGKFLFKIGNRGRGNGEYISPFSISVENGIVYVLCQHTGRLLCYDASTGKYLKTISLQNTYMQVVVSDGYIYAVDMVSKPFAIDSMPLDNPEKKTEIYTSAKGEYIYSSFQQLFQSSKGGCYWVDPLRGRVYELKDGGMIPFIDIDFGMKEHKDKDLLAGEYTSDNEMVSGVSDFYRVGDKCVLKFAGGDKDMHTLIIDLQNGEILNIGSMSYKKVKYPESIYKARPFGIVSADSRFYTYRLSSYYDECGDLPAAYASYSRMKGMDPKKDNITIVAFELK